MKKCLILTCALLCSSVIFGQSYFYNNKYYDNDLLFEVGGSFGTMHGLANVGRKKKSVFLPAMLDFKSTKLNAGFYAGVIYKSLFAGRLELTYGAVAGADSNGFQRDRNLSYRSDIIELSLVGEVHPLVLFNNFKNPLLSPYIATGISVFSFNPQANYNGRWVYLQPLRTEGQGFKEYPDRKPYKLTSCAVIIGAGLKYDLSTFINVRGEALLRQTFTDYLDDAGNSSIDPALFYNYFTPAKANLAAALSNRANNNYKGNVYRGSSKC